MSTINTNGLDVNYPVPGVNNNSQGFRDNFTSIKTNLDITSTELTDLQNKAVVKQALTGSTLNNDMANTLISNASTRSFRATTNNLGNAISGVVIVDVSLADVHYGTIAGNTTLQFSKWAPTNTQSNVQLSFNISNANAVISFPSEVAISPNSGVTTLENFANIANVPTVSVPNGVTTMNYVVSTLDCGVTLTINPTNRPRIATQVLQGTPSPVGLPGDVAGDISIDASYVYVCTASYNAIANAVTVINASSTGNVLTINNTGLLTLNDPIVFTGANVAASGLTENTLYYVKAIATSGVNGTISVSASRTAGTAGSNVTLTTSTSGFSAVTYNGTDIWKRTALSTW